VTDVDVGSGALLGLFDEVNVGHDDLPYGIIYPEIENESVCHKVRDISAGGILSAEVWDEEWIRR
jgi:hypothetical protein